MAAFGTSLITLAVAVSFIGSIDAAGAIGTNHRLSVSPRNEGHAVEGAARMAFVCNDATGAFRVKLSNIQVIEPDGHTPWAHFRVSFSVFPAGDQVDLVFTLEQNEKNGLFGALIKDYMDPAACVTGNQVAVYHEEDFGSALWLQSGLT